MPYSQLSAYLADSSIYAYSYSGLFKRLIMKGLKMGWLKYLMLIVFMTVSAGCEEAEYSDFSFDDSLINQHMDIGVTFQERYRPQYHYTPKINWMNDPNGLDFWSLKSIWN